MNELKNAKGAETAGLYTWGENASLKCRNFQPKYVRSKQGGGVELTDYAKANEKECCIVFTLVEMKEEIQNDE